MTGRSHAIQAWACYKIGSQDRSPLRRPGETLVDLDSLGPQNHHPKIEGLQKGSILRLSPSPNPSPSRAPGLKIERDPPFPKLFSSAFPTVPVEADKTELLPSVAPRAKTARVPRQSPTLGFQPFAASPMTYKIEGLRKAFDLEARGSRVPISPRSQNRKIEKAPSAISPSILLRPAPVQQQQQQPQQTQQTQQKQHCCKVKQRE